MVHQLYQPEKIPQKNVLYHTKMTEKTQQYNSGESSKLKSKAWTSVLKISVDGRYRFGGHRGVLAVQGTNAGGYTEIQ